MTTQRRSEISELLSRVFGEPVLPPPELTRGSKVGAITSITKDLFLDDSEATEMLNSQAQESISSYLSENGVDALAWYQPYRTSGASGWGIYFDVIAMSRYCLLVWAECRRINNDVTFRDVVKVLTAEVMRHEVEHAVQEYLLALAISKDQLLLSQIENLASSAPQSYRETIASHLEHLTPMPPRMSVPQSIMALIRLQSASIVAPPAYSAWKGTSIQELDERFERELGFEDSDLGISLIVRSRLNDKNFIRIPAYADTGNLKGLRLFSSDLRAVGIDCKKFARLIRRDHEAIIPGTRIEDCDDHKSKICGKGIPVEISCHNWDHIPHYVIGQLASLAGVSRSDFIESVHRLL